MSRYAAGLLSGLALAAWALASPRQLRALADWIEDADDDREVRVALKAIRLHDGEKT